MMIKLLLSLLFCLPIFSGLVLAKPVNKKDVKVENSSTATTQADSNSVSIDTFKGKEAFKKAEKRCAAKNNEACYFLAEFYIEGAVVKKDYKKAISIYKKLISAESLFGYLGLGTMYEKGFGVKEDHYTAMEYYDHSCSLDSALGCMKLADLYERGTVIRFDPERTLSLYMRACSLKSMEACSMIGGIYELGIGMGQDIEKAIYYYDIACQGDHLEACSNYVKLIENK